MAQPHVLLMRQLSKKMRSGAALGHDRYAMCSRRRLDGSGPGDGVLREVDEAQAVGAQQPNAAPLGQTQNSVLFGTACGAKLGIASAQDDGRASASVSQVSQRLRHGFTGHHDEPQVQLLTHCCAVGGAKAAMRYRTARVDQVEAARISVTDQVVVHAGRPAGFI